MGMTSDIGQALLDDAKHGRFYVSGQASKLIGTIEINLDIAAARKFFDVPADR